MPKSNNQMFQLRLKLPISYPEQQQIQIRNRTNSNQETDDDQYQFLGFFIVDSDSKIIEVSAIEEEEVYASDFIGLEFSELAEYLYETNSLSEYLTMIDTKLQNVPAMYDGVRLQICRPGTKAYTTVDYFDLIEEFTNQ